jgi:hypothetical protein
MKPANLFVSLMGLLLGFFMISAGLFLFLVPYVPNATAVARSIVIHHLSGLSYFGFALSFFGIFFLTIFAGLNRRRYFLFEMGGISVDADIVACHLKAGMEKFFIDKKIDCSVLIKKKGRLEVFANLPKLTSSNEKNVLFEIEKELCAILKTQFHYEHTFIFNVSWL